MAVYTRGNRALSNQINKTTLRGRLALAAAVSLTVPMMWSASAEAARGKNDIKGAQVLSGTAQISAKGNVTTIRATDRTIIRYDRFNIPKGATVKFVQPSSTSRVLNRIDGAMPSRIEGRMTANGMVFLVNPAGVMFGPTAVIDVGQLYAAAGSISDQDFLGGVNKFTAGRGAVVNQGAINAEAVHLFGAQVVNRGSIVADGGVVTMSSGKDVYISEEGGNIMVKVGEIAPGAAKGSAVINSGTIAAGSVRLKGAGDVYSLAVNTSGMIKSKDIAVDAGKGTAVVSGKLDASDNAVGAKGGNVTVTGNKVALIGASVDASGAAGGGTVLVGGDVHGGGTTPTAAATLVNSTSSIKADATTAGDGGKVVVWSDKRTVFNGDISAKGGATSGNGGFVEVSGKQKLVYNGQVNVTATNGTAGTLLLDPDSILISSTAPVDINGPVAPGTDDISALDDLNDEAIFTGQASVISNTAVSGLLSGGNSLVLQAHTFITLDAASPIVGGADSSLSLQAPTVNLNSTITLSGSGVLTGATAGTLKTLTVNVGSGGSIQNGVDVAAATATVNVVAGTFAGNVSVNKSLTLNGANSTVTGFDVTRGAETIVQGQVALSAANTTFKGFTVEGVTTGTGIVASNAQGDVISNNIITNNVFGMSIASDGSAQAQITGNVFDTNTQPGSASGNGIYTDFTVSNVLVQNNHFTGNGEGSVSFFGSVANPQSNVQIKDNLILDDGPIGLESISDVTISGNFVTNTNSHGIWMARGVSTVTIEDNALINNGGAGIKFDDSGSGAANTGITIHRNSISGNDDGGIVFETGATAVTITNNFLFANGGALPAGNAGINFIGGTSSNVTINNNSITSNLAGGLKIAAGTYTGTLDAKSNWWGSADGPLEAGNTYNKAGQTELITRNGVPVDYVRWLSDGTDLGGGVGFEENAASLFAPITVGAGFFSNIQDAHDANIGDTINLASGTYTGAVTTSRAIALQFTGNGTLANSAGALTLGGDLTIGGTGTITLAENTVAGANTLTVDTRTSLGSDVAINNTVSATDLVNIKSNGAVTQTGAISAARLSVDAVGPVTLEASNSIGTLAAKATGAGNAISFKNSGALALNSIGLLNGVQTSNGNVLIDSGQMTIQQPIAAGTGTVRLVSSSGITQSGSGTITGLALGVNAAGDVVLTLNNPTVNFAANNGAFRTEFIGSGAVTVGSVGASGTFTAAPGIHSSGDVLLKSTGANNLAINNPIVATGGKVRLVSGDTVTQTAAITAAELGVRSGDDVILDTVANDVDRLAILSGGVAKFKDADDLRLSTITADTNAFFTATSGVSGIGVELTSVGLIQDGFNPIDGGTGTVLIDANDGVITLGSSIATTNTSSTAVRIIDSAATNLRAITVGSGGRVVIGEAGGDRVGDVGDINQIIATELSINSSGSVSLSNVNNTIGTLLASTVNGNLTVIDSGGGLTVGAISGTAGNSLTLTTSGGALALTSGLNATSVNLTGAGITQSAGTVAGTSLVVTSTGAVGSSGSPINTAVSNISGTSAGGLFIENTGALTIAGALTNSTSGTMRVRASSPLTVSADVSSAGDLTLEAVGSGLPGDDLTISANVTSTGGGTITLKAGENILHTSGAITSNAGGADKVVFIAGSEAGGTGAITQSGGSLNTDNVSFTAIQNVSYQLAGANDVRNIDASVSGAGQTFAYRGIGTLTSTGSGVSTNGGGITLRSVGTVTATAAINSNGAATSITSDAGDIEGAATISGSTIDLVATAGGIGKLAAVNVSAVGNVTASSGGAGSAGNISLNSGGNLSLGAVSTAGGSAQTVSATGPNITVANAAESLSGDAVVLDAGTGTVTINDTNYNVGAGSLRVNANEIDLAGGAGSVRGTGGGTLVLQPATASRNITLGGAANVVGQFTLTNGDIAAIQSSFGQMTVGRSGESAATLPIGSGTVTLASDATFATATRVFGGNFVGTPLATPFFLGTSAGGLTLRATSGTIGTSAAIPLHVAPAGTLTVQTDAAGASGNIFIKDSAALNLGANITTAAGTAQTVDITASGITVTASNTGTSNDNITLTSSAAVAINSGATLSGGNIAINAATGISDGGTGAISATGNLTLVSAAGDIGTSGANLLTVSVGGTLTLGSVLTPVDGNVFIDSPVSLTLGAVNTTASPQSINFVVGSNMVLANTIIGNDNWDLAVGGNLSNDGTRLTAASVIASAARIGPVSGVSSETFNVATTSIIANAGSDSVRVDNISAAAVTIGSLSAGGTGIIDYAQSGGGTATFGPVNTNNGSITLANGGAGITLGSPVTAGGSGNVTVTTLAGGVTVSGAVSGDDVAIDTPGNVLVNSGITASGTASVTSSTGNITGSGTVGGSTVSLSAVTGIGGPGLDVAAGTLNASTSGAGASINLTTSAAGTTRVNNVTTVGGGNITITQSGSGSLSLVNVAAPGANVTLISGGTINEFTNDDAGVHVAEIISATADLTATGGIGTTSRVDLNQSGALTLHSSAGGANVADNNGLTLGASSVAGNLTAVAETGNLTTTGLVSIGGTGVLTALQPGATATLAPLTGGTGDITITADGGITFNGLVNGGNTIHATAASGDVIANADIGDSVLPVGVDFNGINIQLFNVNTTTGNQAYTASGLVTLNGSGYRTTGGKITFNGNVALAAPTVNVSTDVPILFPAGNDITFSGNVNGASTLTLSAGTAGNILVSGNIGAGPALVSVNATGHNINLQNATTSLGQLYTANGMVTLNGTYTADSGSIEFAGNATLASNTTVNANGGTNSDDILFDGTITGPGSLTATALGLGDFVGAGAGGVGTALGAATISANDITLNGMTTVGAQSYTASGIIGISGAYSNGSGAITFAAGTTTLNADASVTAGGGTDADDIVITGNIDASPVHTHSLTLTTASGGDGDVVIGGNIDVGFITANAQDIGLNNVTTATGQTYTASGTLTLNGTSLNSTAGNILINGNTQLGNDVAIDTHGGGNVTFNGTINGGQILIVRTNSGDGTTTFNGVVGGTTQLTSVLTDPDGFAAINGGAVSTTGNQTYGEALTLGANTTITAANVEFGSSVNSSGGARDLVINVGGVTMFDDRVGNLSPLRNLTTDVGGSTAINGGLITTTENQQFNDAVTLGTVDAVLNGIDITFGSTVNGPNGLTVNGSGVTKFVSTVGHDSTLAFLITDSAGSTQINGGEVKTTAAQTYGDPTTLGVDTILNGTGVTFSSTLDSAAASLHDLTINDGGTTTFGAAVGGIDKLKNLIDNGATAINGGSISTSEDQTYNGAVTLGADATLLGNDITFASTVDGAQGLIVNTTGSGFTIFGGAVGSGPALTSLTTNADGTTRINGGAVTTTGAQIYGDTLQIGTMDATLAGGSVTFSKTVDSAPAAHEGLTVNSGGATVFTGAVGNINFLKSLTTDAAGTTSIGGGIVNTDLDQTYGDPVSLGADTVLSGNDITFASTLNGAFALTVTSTGLGSRITTFGGIVGGSAPLASIATNGGAGETRINTTAITTTGDQTYGDKVTLGSDTTLAGNDVSFALTLDSDATATARTLTINTTGSGNTTFGGLVGATGNLNKLTTNSDGTTFINGGGVTTVQQQLYNDAVVLAPVDPADPPLPAPPILPVTTILSGTDITFGNTLDSDAAGVARDLTINASLATTFGGAVGGVHKLGNLKTDAPGTTNINGGSVLTIGDQTYQDAVVLGANTTISGTNIRFEKTLNSDASTDRDLTVTSNNGLVRFGQAVGGVDSLRNLTADDSGTTGKTSIAGGAITTSGTQLYKANLELEADTGLTGTTFTFNKSLNSAGASPFDLTLNSTTAGVNTTFLGAVGTTHALKNFTSTNTGTTALNGGAITTTATQLYQNAVTLGANTVLTGVGVTFKSTLNGARIMNINNSGATEFDGIVGGSAPLTSLTTDGPGSTLIKGGAVSTTAAQSYGDTVTLGADTTFTGGDLAFAQTIDSDATAARNLVVRSNAGNVSVLGDIGILNKIALADFAGTLTTNTAKNISVHSIKSTGDQLFKATTLVTINGDYISDAGKYNVDGNTSLGGKSKVQTTSAGLTTHDITFTGTIDGNHTLTLAALGNGSVKLSKAVGGTTPLGGLVAAAQNIETNGVKTKRTSAVDLDKLGTISLKVDENTTPDSRFHKDSDGKPAVANKPDGVMTVRGNLDSNGGDIFLGARSTRDDSAIVAFPSILLNPTTAGGTINISGKNITMGANEKLVANGSVNINGTGTVTLSDITALDSIDVTGGNIIVQQRPSGTVIAADGKSLLHDVNTDFVAGNRIHFSGSSSVQGSIPDQQHRVLFATVKNDVSGTPSGTSIRALNADEFSIKVGKAANGDFIDLRAQGASISNPASALAGAVAQESRQPELSRSLGTSVVAELAQLGIFAKDLKVDELMAFLEGVVLYNDVPGNIATGRAPRDDQYEVTKNRLAPEAVRRVLDLYYSTYFEKDKDGRPLIKDTKKIQKIREAIDNAATHYRAKTGQKTGAIDPVAFREYVDSTPIEAEARQDMDKLRELFNEIQPRSASSRKGLGLSQKEAEISRKVLLGNLELANIDVKTLELAILAESKAPPAPRPVIAKPAVVKPVSANPTVAKPAVAKPAVVKPAPVKTAAPVVNPPDPIK